MSDLLYILNKYLINEVTTSMAWRMMATGYQEAGKKHLCFQDVMLRSQVDNEDQGKLVGSQQQGTENTQVLEHNSNWWGSGGRT